MGLESLLGAANPYTALLGLGGGKAGMLKGMLFGNNGMAGLSQNKGLSQFGFGLAQQNQIDPITGQAQNAQADPEFIAAQKTALSKMLANSDQHMTQAEKDNLTQNMNAVNQNTAARTNQILSNQASRGLGGSGMSAAMLANAEQGGANAGANAGLGASQMAQSRALGSLAGYGNLASEGRQQSFNEAMGRGEAADRTNIFNNYTRNMGNNQMQQDALGQMMGANNNMSNLQAQRYNQNASRFYDLLGKAGNAGAMAAL